jgi:arylsulfatase
MDFAPTFLELAGVSLPPASEKTVSTELGKGSATTKRSMTTFRGKDVHAMRGKSWIPHFARGKKIEDDEVWAIHSSSEPVGWELFARGALRKGDWKIVHFDKTEGGAGEGDEGWELFNVAQDPGETTDLAKTEPEKLKELLAHWDEYIVECGIVWGEVASSSGVSKDEAPQLWEDEVELQKAWIGARGGDCPVDCK